jgi:hypothetical protein
MAASSIEKATLDHKNKKYATAATTTESAEEIIPATRVVNACAIDDPTCEACQ